MHLKSAAPLSVDLNLLVLIRNSKYKKFQIQGSYLVHACDLMSANALGCFLQPDVKKLGKQIHIEFT